MKNLSFNRLVYQQAKHFTYSGLIIFFFLWGCSAEKKTMVSKLYHNTTARYNAYWIAREHMKEIESVFRNQSEENYNKILDIYPDIDTTISNSVSEQIEETIKKASIAIQNHKNSKWVDDSYILVGKARYYDADFVNAIETFKFVNTKSENDDARHEALVNLMRTFIDYKEYQNAIAVSDYLKKEDLNKENLKNLYLTRAHLHQERGDLNEMVKNLNQASPLLSKKDGRARIYFIMGQLYQKLGFDAQAYENYKESLKDNPPYELSFYAKLNMATVFELADKSDIKKARKYFLKLLEDSKNKEFRDKIYYEMAEFEMRQNNLDQAIDYYKNSVQSSVNNQRQKGFSYWKLAQIHFDTLKKYQLAKSYYDSTIASLPSDEPAYDSIKQRQEILADFVDQINTITLQDSLLSLAEMDTTALNSYVDEILLAREEEKENIQNQQSSSPQAFDEQDNPFAQADSRSSSGATWYFYNMSAVSTGQAEFVRKWGKRPLEDNWRRKESSADFGPVTLDEDNEATLPEEQNAGAEESDAFRQEFFAAIPFSDEAKQLAYDKIEEAYYKLGNIYNFQLNEKADASEAFETLLDSFPDSDYESEILYLLYLIYKDLENQKYLTYKDRLLEEFPHTTYAKTILNPNYKEESNAASEQLKQHYRTAYALYNQQEYQKADSVINRAMNELPENDFTDNIRLLQIMVQGKTGNIATFQFALQQFLEEYPESDVFEYAREMLNYSREFDLKQAARHGASFIKDFTQAHYFVLVYDKETEAARNLPEKVDEFNKQNFENLNLTSGNLILNEDQAFILVNEFPGKAEAMQFYQAFNGKNEVSSNEGFQPFIITKDNFEIFYRTKDLKNYVSFFEKHYR